MVFSGWRKLSIVEAILSVICVHIKCIMYLDFFLLLHSFFLCFCCYSFYFPSPPSFVEVEEACFLTEKQSMLPDG